MGRQRTGPTPSFVVGLWKSTSFRALIKIHEQSLQAWACLFCTKMTPYRNVSSDGSMNVLTQLQRVWLQGRACRALTWRTQPYTVSYSKGRLPEGPCAERQKECSGTLWGAEQGKRLRGEDTRQREERCSECRCILQVRSHHPFLLLILLNSTEIHPYGGHSHLCADYVSYKRKRSYLVFYFFI